MQYERQNKEKQSNNAIKWRDKMKKTKQKGKKKRNKKEKNNNKPPADFKTVQ